MNNRRKFINSLALLGTGMLVSKKSHAHPSKSHMIHQVYFWLKNPKKDLKSFIKGCEKLIKIDTIQKAYIGQPASTENREVVDHSFHVSLTLHFKTLEDHNSYQIDPAHKAFIEKHSDNWEKVQVFDSKID